MDSDRVEQAALASSIGAALGSGLATLLGLDGPVGIGLFLAAMVAMLGAAVLYVLYTILVVAELLDEMDVSVQSRLEPR